MKYLQMIECQSYDLADSVYNDITVPSVRYIKDTNTVVARKATTENEGKVIDMAFLLNNYYSADTALTNESYLEGLSAGTYTSEYASSLAQPELFDSILETANEMDFEDIENKLNFAYCVYESFSGIESTLLNAICYEDDYNVDITGAISINSGDSATTVINQYEKIVSFLDFNGDGKIDEDDAQILMQFKKFFPEQITTAGYNKAYELLSANTFYITDIVNSVLGIEEYNEDFDLNGNGIVDEEDLALFISADIFGELGLTERASASRTGVRRANIFSATGNTGCGSNPIGRPPRTRRPNVQSGERLAVVSGNMFASSDIRDRIKDSNGRTIGWSKWRGFVNGYARCWGVEFEVSTADSAHLQQAAAEAAVRNYCSSSVSADLVSQGYGRDTKNHQYKISATNVTVTNWYLK